MESVCRGFYFPDITRTQGARVPVLYAFLVPTLFKGLSINNLRNLAPRFGPDLDGTIEKKPRHSLDYVEVFSIEARSKMARRWDARW